MSISINIDETPRKPNVRPPTPASKRGPLTFIVDIEQRNRRTIKRNLTRGVDDTTDPIVIEQPPIIPQYLSLSSLVVNLSNFFIEPIDPGTGPEDSNGIPGSDIGLNFGFRLGTVTVDLDNAIGVEVGDIDEVGMALPGQEINYNINSAFDDAENVVELSAPEPGISLTSSPDQIEMSLYNFISFEIGNIEQVSMGLTVSATFDP